MTNSNFEFARSATSKDGLAHPRLARAADELRHALPATLGGRVLLFVRAFKFASDLEAGLGAEPGDELGGVKVNVWLTPDTAVVNAASAPALVVHNLSTADWAPAFVPAPEGDEDDPTLFEVRAHSRCDPFFPCVEVRAHSRCDHSSFASRRDRFRDTKLGRRLLFVSSRVTRVAPPPGARHAAAAAPPHRHAFRPSARFAVRPLSLFFTSLFLLSRSQVRRRHGAGGVPPEPRRRLRRAARAPRRGAAVPLGLREPPRRPPVCVRQLKWPDPLAPRRELPSRRRSSLSLSSRRLCRAVIRGHMDKHASLARGSGVAPSWRCAAGARAEIIGAHVAAHRRRGSHRACGTRQLLAAPLYAHAPAHAPFAVRFYGGWLVCWCAYISGPMSRSGGRTGEGPRPRRATFPTKPTTRHSARGSRAPPAPPHTPPHGSSALHPPTSPRVPPVPRIVRKHANEGGGTAPLHHRRYARAPSEHQKRKGPCDRVLNGAHPRQ